ncbi:D-alanyl-D-alanine carboxypeptidase family protein, partial [Actinocorallia lasiicapitis]
MAGAVALGVAAGAAPALAANVPPVPKVAAKGYAVVDAGTGQVLAGRDLHGHYLPASTIKTLTSAALLPKLKASDRIRPNRQTVGAVPVKVGLSGSRTYRVDDLFRAMMLKSANDAAYGLAQAGGGMKETIAAMNAEAARLGARDTRAGSPNGLDRDLGLTVKTQHTSAHDLALIMRQAIKLPEFVKYASPKSASFPGGVTLRNGNKLQRTYPGMIAGKNGRTMAAGRTYVGAAKRDGRTIIVAELGSGDSLWKDSAALLDWGFKAAGKVKPVATLPSADAQAAPKGGSAKDGSAETGAARQASAQAALAG